MDLALIAGLPFLAVLILISPLNQYLTSTTRTWALTAMMALLFAAFIGYFPYIAEAPVVRSIEYVPELGISLSFYLDGLALIFALVITGIGAGIFLYTGYYFDEEADQKRFYLWLTAFAGAMLGVVIAGNLITMFIMWELTSITSFMLIGFKGAKYEEARFGAFQAFLVTGGGALALIAGIVVMGAAAAQVLGLPGFTFELSQILQADLSAHPHYNAIVLLMALGAFTKSAQFPFHFWLPGAMQAPTPASAYLHSATMVKAGVYLMARLYPPLHNGEFWTQLLVFIGLFTMLIGAFFALSKRDLKGLLAYSTVSMLGAMIALIGLPDYAGLKAAYVTILAHALYKAALFLVVGTVEHSTGSRIIDQLGGLRRYMPGFAVVTVISALSMSGVPLFFGFVSKEVLLDAFVLGTFPGAALALGVVTVSAGLTVIAALIVIWDVFFKEMSAEVKEHFHFHAPSPWLLVGPGLMAFGSTVLGFLIPQLIKPLVQSAIPKPISLYLIPDEFWTVLAFQLSMTALAAGLLLFYLRNLWLGLVDWPLPKGEQVFRRSLDAMNWVGDFTLRSQNGQLRYYMVVILGAVAAVVLFGGLLTSLGSDQFRIFGTDNLASGETALRIVLLLLTCASALLTVIARRHITAALALGVMGYSVGGIFLLEPAPDVALVQFLVETLATVLIVLMLSRIPERQRREAMKRLWRGRFALVLYDRSGETSERNIVSRIRNIGIYRDLGIAIVAGFTVFLFALTALANRPDRASISEHYLQNTYTELGVTDVVGAIVADYRAMDTILEIAVFAVAAIGVLTLLSRGLTEDSPLSPPRRNVYATEEFEPVLLEDIKDPTKLNTPFTQLVSRIVLPLSLMVALSHLVFGSNAPGDGFTAGAIAGLATAIWYVVFGYEEAKARLNVFRPSLLLQTGLVLAVVNGLLPIALGGNFMGHVNYGSMLGIEDTLAIFGLKFTSTLLFEIGIALTVFGGFAAITETIAHPKRDADFVETGPALAAASAEERQGAQHDA